MSNSGDDQNSQHPLSARLKIGEPFDTFIVESLLGRGGMGEVYKVRHQTLDSVYAIKVLPPSFAKRQDALQRFQNEARVMSRLDHGNIVRVDDFRMTDGLYWLRMELARGDEHGSVSLQEMADRNRGVIPISLLLPLMQDVLAGVAYAHDNGVIHRDLKPANVLIFPGQNNTLRAKVSDYGLVKLLGEEFQRTQVTSIISVTQTESCEGSEEDTFNRALIGTWEYMSPEQQESGDVGKASDVYSLGLMIYRLLTGRKLSPWPPSHYDSSLNKDIDVFVLRALEPEPQDRFEDAGHMLTALDSIVASMDHDDIEFELPPELIAPDMDPELHRYTDDVVQETPHLNSYPVVETDGGSGSSSANINEQRVAVDMETVRTLVESGQVEEAVIVLNALSEVVPDHPAVVNELRNIQRLRHQKQLDELQAAAMGGGNPSGKTGVFWIVILFMVFCGLVSGGFWLVSNYPDLESLKREFLPKQSTPVHVATPATSQLKPTQTVSMNTTAPDDILIGTATPATATPGTTPVASAPSVATATPTHEPTESQAINSSEPIAVSATTTPLAKPTTKPTPVSSGESTAEPTVLSANDGETSGTASRNTAASGADREDPFASFVMRIEGLDLEFLRIKAGSFLMGSDQEGSFEKPMHYVKISQDFHISRYEVTLADYRQFMKESGNTEGINWADNNCPFRFLDGFPITGFKFGQVDTQPVVKVSWFGARDFCAWLTARERKAGRLREGYEYRLPTEAEWEYVSRAGSSTRYHWGDDWDCGLAMGENDPRSSENICVRFYKSRRIPVKATAPVGSFQPNMWGIYDMNGNVWEWCHDWFGQDYYQNSTNADPTGPESGQERVIRGGSWLNAASKCTSSYRGSSSPGTYHSTIGFRPVLARRR